MGEVDIRYELDLAPESVWIMATPDPAVKRAAAHVSELGDFIAGARYFTRRSNLPSYLIKFTLEGAGQLEYDGRREGIGEGSAFWIDCTRPQFYRTAPGQERWRVAWVHFYGPGLRRLLPLVSRAQRRLELRGAAGRRRRPPALIGRLIDLYRGGVNTLADDAMAAALLTHVMAELISAARRRRPARPDAPCVAGARAYLLKHYSRNVSLAELAQAYRMDRFYLQKLFKKHTGLSPKKFQLLTRVNRAKELLQATDLPVSEIAGRVGVESASRFIALFRAYEGRTPGDYRRKWRGR